MGQIVRGPDNKPYQYLGIQLFVDKNVNPFGCITHFAREDGTRIEIDGGVRTWYRRDACGCDDNSWRPGFTEWRDKDGNVIAPTTWAEYLDRREDMKT
jgi:hypothetical protein